MTSLLLLPTLSLPFIPVSPTPTQGKLKNHRKSQSQTIKSLYLDYGPAPQSTSFKNRRKNKYQSGEIRTKSGDSVETTRIISKSALDSLLSQKGSKKFNNFPEQPLNDRHYDDLDDTDLSRELPHSIYDYDKTQLTKQLSSPSNDDGGDGDGDDDDDDDYDDPAANQEYINAYKHGDDPNKILNSWTNNKRKLNPSASTVANSNLPEQTSSRSSSTALDLPDSAGGAANNGGKGGNGGPILGSGLISRLPGPPRDLVAQIVKPRFVTLSWIEPIKNPAEVVSYTVYYKMNNSER